MLRNLAKGRPALGSQAPLRLLSQTERIQCDCVQKAPELAQWQSPEGARQAVGLSVPHPSLPSALCTPVLCS